MGNEQQRVDVLARALFEAYSRNGGNPPDAHYDRNAAEQWMAQALVECGVIRLISENERAAWHLGKAVEYIEKVYPTARKLDRDPILRNMRRWSANLRAALANVGAQS